MLLADVVERNARTRPTADALCFGGPDRTRTWRDLFDRSTRLANAVAALVEPGTRVALLAENCPEYFECYYGVPDARAALTLLNYRQHPRELVWILNDCRAEVLIARAPYARMIQDLRAELPQLRTVVTVGEHVPGALDYEDVLRDGRPSRTRVAHGDDPAWVVYTSGTTGRPKGAVLSHHNLSTSIIQSVIHYSPAPDARFLNAFPLCHVAGYMAIVHQFRGGMVLQQGAWDPQQWVHTVADQRVTSGGLAPSMLATVLDSGALDDADVSSLAALGYGAAAMPVDVLRRTIDRLGPIVFTGYGMTELAGNVLALDRETHARAARGDDYLLESAGSAMCLSEVRVVDDEGVPCPTGMVGEIVVRGDQTMLGYLDRPGATAEAYADGWLHTGDLARVDDEGFFYIVDRIKDMIITGGENVYSMEVENALSEHPAVAESAVFGTSDRRWGERVTAVVVLRSGHTATADDLTGFCRDRLAGYKLPRRIVFADAIPKTATGKALKRVLRDQYLDESP